tara:strand:- start:196316 stop:196714 length:399 start_codon:yes stop_codon:yes gene_type:complete
MFSSSQKLYINVSDTPSELTLESVFAGEAGTLNLGKNGVHLWVPGDNIPVEKEIIFDIRSRPLSETDFETFKAACKGRFMAKHIALMVSTNLERIKALLEYYDYVLVPNNNIKNLPTDFVNRVLSYKSDTKN